MTTVTARFSTSRAARVRSGLLVALLCVAGLAAMPAVSSAYEAEHVAGFAAAMPDDAVLSRLSPGDTIVVPLVPSATARRHHRVAVVTLARRGVGGAAPTLVARSVLRGGLFHAQIPPAIAGTYVLRVQVGRRAFTEATFEVDVTHPVLSAPCGDLPAESSAELSVDPGNPRPGAMVNFSFANTGPGCLTTGYGFDWQVSRGGSWVDVPLHLVVPSVLVSLQPGNALSDTFTVPVNTAPGQYRIVKHFRAAGEDDEIAVAVEVVARRHA